MEDFNNHGDRVTCFLDISLLLSPVTTIVFQWTHEQSGPVNRNGGYPQVTQQELLLTKTDVATTITECPICQHLRSTLNPRYGTVPLGEQPAICWQVDYTELFLSWKG